MESNVNQMMRVWEAKILSKNAQKLVHLPSAAGSSFIRKIKVGSLEKEIAIGRKLIAQNAWRVGRKIATTFTQ